MTVVGVQLKLDNGSVLKKKQRGCNSDGTLLQPASASPAAVVTGQSACHLNYTRAQETG